MQEAAASDKIFKAADFAANELLVLGGPHCNPALVDAIEHWLQIGGDDPRRVLSFAADAALALAGADGVRRAVDGSLF